MNLITTWLYPAAPDLRNETRDVLLFGAMARFEDDDEPIQMSLKGKPLKRARAGTIPLAGTEARLCFDAIPIAPSSTTSAEVAAMTTLSTKRTGTVLDMLTKRRDPIVHKIGGGKAVRWTRTR